jgi:hypothetical protein
MDRKMMVAGMLGAIAGMAGGTDIGSCVPTSGRRKNVGHGKKGMAERLRDAKTLAEVDALMAEANGYSGVSAKTRRRWTVESECARKRIGS